MKYKTQILTMIIGLFVALNPVIAYIGYCTLIQSYNCSESGAGMSCMISCAMFIIGGVVSIAGLNGALKN